MWSRADSGLSFAGAEDKGWRSEVEKSGGRHKLACCLGRSHSAGAGIRKPEWSLGSPGRLGTTEVAGLHSAVSVSVGAEGAEISCFSVC